MLIKAKSSALWKIELTLENSRTFESPLKTYLELKCWRNFYFPWFVIFEKIFQCFQRLPVLVFIYGGGFTTGSSTLPVFDPTVLVTRGNIIFVSMQYRVGAFGFLSAGKGSSAPGSAGLLDQVQKDIPLAPKFFEIFSLGYFRLGWLSLSASKTLTFWASKNLNNKIFK